MVRQAEGKQEDKFTLFVKNYPLPAIALKLKLLAGMGWPDRTVFCNGKVFFIEFKSKNGVLSPQQIYWHKQLRRMGFKVYVCKTKEKAIEIFKKEIQPT